ncbi:hypothetical protein [Amycolatopsis pigmentata]|uniref:Uncharacterized protein n=1 Tax=Amycolatopsis pigmentata TaxID=450801 RepID=A0ABW5G2K0_9PSEU
MKENRLSLALLDREEAELLPTREALDGLTINNIIGINIAIAVGGIAGKVEAAAGQLFGGDD